jgi:hypothetical protein
MNDLPVASDGYAGCWFNPSSKYIFSMPKWTRALIKPPPGYGFAYLDFEQQEIMAAAGLSGDEALMKDARSLPCLCGALKACPGGRDKGNTQNPTGCLQGRLAWECLRDDGPWACHGGQDPARHRN